MSDSNRTYRIRTKVGEEKPYKIDVALTQTYDMFEILSLKLNQKNEYNYYDSNYGVVVGRVLANKGFGIPNAKVSVFIEVDAEESISRKILYNFVSTQDKNSDGVKYNLLPDFVDNACHQDVGTFPNKRLVLDNKDVIEIFDKYYKYTTVTNESGDYMLFGIPVGTQTLHVDIDLSDIGQLSQRPRDMVYKGYNINQFESPNKFKKSTNLNSLAQLYSQDKGLYIYPFYGNSNMGEDHIGITRCDIQIEYEFEPTCVFIGSIVTDKGSNAIGKNCTGTDNVGKMSDLSAGEGTIEMIRKTIDGKVEEFQIKGNRLIDGDGVWCYQIPMNLDYVMTDEFGNIVPTDDPSKGIPTRTRARFRISLDESISDATATKRCRFLVPNNPRYDSVDYPQFYKTKEADYEFGSATREESYCDMFWNNVYTVKSYIPRLQKNKNSTNRKHTGIKLINHYGDNNPMPYNNLSIKLSFTYRLICVLVKVLIWIIATINQILALIMEPICQIANIFLTIAKGLCFSILGIKPLCWLGAPFKFLGNLFMAMVVKGITLGSSFCDDGINRIAFYPILAKIAPCVLDKVKSDFNKEQNSKTNPEERERLKVITITSMDNNELITCIENNLAQSNDATSFNFQNDWVNGVLYAPLWYRKIMPKRTFLFGLFKRKAKDQWCRYDGNFNLMVYQPCALKKSVSDIKSPVDGQAYKKPTDINSSCKEKCHNEVSTVSVNNGLILTRETMLGQTVYYYKAVEYNQQLANTYKNKDGVILLFATDIVLLGSLNDCDSNGIPQFFKNLESTTYKLPTDILFTDTIIQVDAEGQVVVNKDNDIVFEQFTEATGCDWGNLNSFDECGKMGDATDSGLFYGIGCSTIEMTAKSCLNLSRICEFGVSLDDAKDVANLNEIESTDSGFERLTPDGFISFDELYNVNERSMFATLNGNRLRTRLNNKNGLKEYDLRYLYTDNFDGLMKGLMRHDEGGCNYTRNYNLERMSEDYYLFRMGTEPYFYDNTSYALPRYENSFYFYFGLKMGKTAIDKFNSQFFAPCEDASAITSPITVETKPNSWCTDGTENSDGYVLVDLSNISKPCDVTLRSLNDSLEWSERVESGKDKIFFGIYDNLGSDQNYIKEYLGITNEDTIKNDYDKNLIKAEENMIDYIPNGEYELVVTDADGILVTYKFSLKNTKLQFTYDKFDNEVPNNQRLESKNWKDLFTKITSSNYTTYGGYIVINNIINGELPGGNYIIDVEFKDNDLYNKFLESETINKYRNHSSFVVDNEGNVIHVKETNVIKWYDNNLVILVPLGSVDYMVRITELCSSNNEDTSLNFSETYIRVNDTIPYKLFVNDVDTSVLKLDVKDNEGFNVGWNYSVDDDNSIKSSANFSKLDKIWLKLDNISESDKTKYFDFTKLDGYDSLSEEEQKEAQNDFITSLKETFWLTCPGDSKEFNISVVVNNKKLPIKYELYYVDEASSETSTVNMLDTGDYVLGEETQYSVDSILIPTITTADNENYGYSGKTNNNVGENGITFGYDNINGKEKDGDAKWFKKPYGIRVINQNGDGDKLPIKGNVKIGDDNYFFFHLIDKTLRLNMVEWSYVNKIPHPSSEKDNDTISMNGFLWGKVYNGVLNPFNTQQVDNKDIVFNTVQQENDITTSRQFKSFDDDKVDESNRVSRQYSGSVLNDSYIPITNKQTEITIEDSSCYASEILYGNMTVGIKSNDGNDFVFEISKGDNYDDNTTFIFNDNSVPYPLKSAKNADNKWKLAIESNSIMNPTITKDDLLNKCYSDAEGQTINEESGEYEYRGTKYSKNGLFKIKGADGLNFYAVNVTNNNCRVLSPLYMYRTVGCKIFLANIETMTQEGETFTPITENKIGILIDSLPYYLKHYNYKVNLKIPYNEQLNLDETVTNNLGVKETFFNVNESLYAMLKSYFSNDIFFGTIKKKIDIGLIDCTNLRLGTNLTRINAKDYYAVIWEIGNANLNDEDKEKLGGSIEYKEKGVRIDAPISEVGVYGGYVFEGWDANGSPISLPTTVTGSLIIKPRITRVKVTFNAGNGIFSDGSIEKVIEVNDTYNATITETPESTIPTKEFEKWVWVSGGKDLNITDNTVYSTNHVTVKAQYKDKETE